LILAGLRARGGCPGAFYQGKTVELAGLPRIPGVVVIGNEKEVVSG
jgi:hypothetical protein